MFRYLAGFVITIGLIIVLIVLLFSGGDDSPSKKVPATNKAIDSYATTDAQVRLTMDGPINAAVDHRQVQITVDNEQAVLNVFKGYDGEVIMHKSYGNSVNGYTSFLNGLAKLGFTTGISSSKAGEAGRCPTGRRYVFELLQNGRTLARYWATSCGGDHTYGGNVQTTLYLFEQQIPGYRSIDLPINF